MAPVFHEVSQAAVASNLKRREHAARSNGYRQQPPRVAAGDAGLVVENMRYPFQALQSAAMRSRRGLISRIGFAALFRRPAALSSRSNWRSGPCSGATRQTALSVRRSENNVGYRVAKRGLDEGKECGRPTPRFQGGSWHYDLADSGPSGIWAPEARLCLRMLEARLEVS